MNRREAMEKVVDAARKVCDCSYHSAEVCELRDALAALDSAPVDAGDDVEVSDAALDLFKKTMHDKSSLNFNGKTVYSDDCIRAAIAAAIKEMRK